MDLRIQKTYKALTDTFLELLEEKHFEDITVEELCSRAMIRRATFYKHFADKNDFFVFLVREIQQKFIDENLVNAYAPYCNEGALRSFIEFMCEHEKLVKSISESSMFLLLADMICERSRSICNFLSKKYSAGAHIFPYNRKSRRIVSRARSFRR
ncbi:MAG: TetR/AcrR family transcriptional regulator [Candidatus Borkfalkia sp.]